MAWSVGLHLAAVIALVALGRRPPAPPPAAPEPLAVDLVEAPSVVPPPEAPVPEAAAEAAAAPAPRHRRAPVAPRVTERAAAPSPPSAPAAAAPDAPAPSPPTPPGPVDRLATLRPRPHVAEAPFTPRAPDVPPGPQAFLPAPDVIHRVPLRDPVGTTREGNGLEARTHADGRMTFRDPPALDLNDAVMRALGQDPYRAQKHDLLEATRDARICLAEKEAIAVKQAALGRLKGELEAVALDQRRSLAERHAAVFEVWDDCIEERGDALAAAARATIVAVIRRAFPEGTPTAYAPAELALLNRRRTSRVPLDPYGRRDAGAP